MIKYNNNTIYDWNFDASNIIKVYRNNAIVFYKVSGESPSPTSQTPCFAVVDDISQYQETEFEDVFNNADGKWYKLNNLNQYEEYGVYGSGRTITTYDGKLTIDGDYEYIYSGNSWSNLGEISGSSIVPQGYTEVEYITSENISSTATGPYIDTNFTPNQNTRVVLDYQPTVNNQQNRRIFGSGRFNNTSSGNYIWSMEGTLGQSNCKFYYKFDNGGSSWSTTSVVPDLNRHVVDFNREGKIWLDDTAIVTLPSNTVNCSYHIGIFNEIGTEIQPKEFLMGRVYSCQVYDNGTLVRDFVPCINPSNVVGLYDIVNDVFYSSARNEYQFGAGAETKTLVYPMYYDVMQDPPNNLVFSSMTEAESYECPWVGMKATIDGDRYIFSGDSISGYEWVYQAPRLPVGYTEVEYIQNYSSVDASNNNLSYLNTNFTPTQNTRTVADIKIDKGTRNPRLLGNGRWNSLGYILSCENYVGSDGKLYYKFGQTSSWYQTSVSVDMQRHVYDFNNNGQLLVDNTSIATLPSTTFTCVYPMGIFTATRTASDLVDLNETIYGTLYSCQIYDNGTLVRDFVPCINPSNVVGLYDVVNDVFYGSANNNNFVAGSPI